MLTYRNIYVDLFQFLMRLTILIKYPSVLILKSKFVTRYNRLYLYLEVVTLRTSDAGIPALRKLPCCVGRRYTGFVQTSLWSWKSVYRRTVCQRQASDAGIPAFAYWHLNAQVI